MGKYINKTTTGTVLSAVGKADQLIADGAKEIPEPSSWEPNLVCVVENNIFDAAAWAYDEREMNVFKRPDGRDKRWLIHPQVEEIVDK